MWAEIVLGLLCLVGVLFITFLWGAGAGMLYVYRRIQWVIEHRGVIGATSVAAYFGQEIVAETHEGTGTDVVNVINKLMRRGRLAKVVKYPKINHKP